MCVVCLVGGARSVVFSTKRPLCSVTCRWSHDRFCDCSCRPAAPTIFYRLNSSGRHHPLYGGAGCLNEIADIPVDVLAVLRTLQPSWRRLSLPPSLPLALFLSHTLTPRTCNTSSCSHTPTANLPDLSTGDLLTPRLAEVTSKGPCSAKRVFPPGPRPAVGAHWCRVVSDCNLSLA